MGRRYADDRLGVLNLDVDRLRGMVGRSRQHFAEVGEIVRPLALSTTTTHLRGGRDVIMPQFLGRVGEVERSGRSR